MSDDLDDNAETTAGLLEVVRRLVSTYKHLQMDTPKDQAILDKATDLAERALDTLAARLADSRPVVSEAAIEAAVEVLRHLYGDHAVMPYYEARQIFTAALPHMSDGKGEAEHERVLQGVKDCWKVDMRENRLLRDGIEKLADELEQQHRDAFGESLADNFPSALVTDLRDLLNPPRLSPTGDDTQ